jgi:hypothetical protein
MYLVPTSSAHVHRERAKPDQKRLCFRQQKPDRSQSGFASSLISHVHVFAHFFNISTKSRALVHTDTLKLFNNVHHEDRSVTDSDLISVFNSGASSVMIFLFSASGWFICTIVAFSLSSCVTRRRTFIDRSQFALDITNKFLFSLFYNDALFSLSRISQ